MSGDFFFLFAVYVVTVGMPGAGNAIFYSMFVILHLNHDFLMDAHVVFF